MTPMIIKKDLQSFLVIWTYLGKFSPSTTEVNDLLRKLTSLKYKWTWHNIYQSLYDRAKTIIKKNATMIFFNGRKTTVHRNRCMECWSVS